MNNPFDLLRKDHEIIEASFAEYEGLDAEAYSERKRVADQFDHQLRLHRKMEEMLCYPRLREALHFSQPALVEDAQGDHAEIRSLLELLRALDETSPPFHDCATEVIRSARTHILEEERDLFPHALAHMSESELGALGDDIIVFMESKGGATP